jgi:hypothetical protein
MSATWWKAATAGAMAALVAAVAGWLALSGHHTSTPRHSSDKAVVGAPSSGACYGYTAQDYLNRLLPGAPPTACSGRHTAETFQVITAADLPATRPASPSTANLTYCPTARLNQWLGARPTGFPTLYIAVAVYPDKEQWARGEHWVRCDALLADSGTFTTFTNSQAGSLTGKALAPFAQCQVPHEFPDGMGTVLTTCTGHPKALVVAAQFVPDVSASTGRAREKASWNACAKAVAPFVTSTVHLLAGIPPAGVRAPVDCMVPQTALSSTITRPA